MMPRASSPKRLRVRVDPIRCTAFGYCAELCPELFDLDEWGYAWLKTHDVDGDAAEIVWKAARCCPRKAIIVEEVIDISDVSEGNTWPADVEEHGQ